MRAWAASAEGPAVLLFTRSRDLEVWIDTLGDRSAKGTTAPEAEDGPPPADHHLDVTDLTIEEQVAAVTALWIDTPQTHPLRTPMRVAARARQ